jgi:hypothetical protein
MLSGDGLSRGSVARRSARSRRRDGGHIAGRVRSRRRCRLCPTRWRRWRDGGLVSPLVDIRRDSADVRSHLRRIFHTARDWHGPRRRRRFDTHGPHPRPLSRRLGVGPGEVRPGREILNVVMHILARRQGHARVFHLAADRGQDPAHCQRRPERHASRRGHSRCFCAGQPHCFHPPWRLRRTL